MKYLYVVFLLVADITIVFCQTCGIDTLHGEVKRFYPDFPMNVPPEGYEYLFDTLSDGNWKQYRESQSHVYKIWHVSMGKLQGPMVYFNNWGEQTSIECYEGGQLSSVASYHSNGNISEIRIFNKEKEIVSRKSWYANEVLMIDANNNVQRRWSDNGYLQYRKRFENNSLVHVELYRGDQLYYQGFWKDGNPINGRQYVYRKNSTKSIQYSSLSKDSRRIIESNDLLKK